MAVLTRRSLNLLATVNPRLKEVVVKAAELSPVDFVVVQGRRTWEEQVKLYGKGRTEGDMLNAGLPMIYAQPDAAKETWSIESVYTDGNSVDLAAWVDGRIVWDTSLEKGYYQAIARAMKQASNEVGAVVIWGGDDCGQRDFTRFEIREPTAIPWR